MCNGLQTSWNKSAPWHVEWREGEPVVVRCGRYALTLDSAFETFICSSGAERGVRSTPLNEPNSQVAEGKDGGWGALRSLEWEESAELLQGGYSKDEAGAHGVDLMSLLVGGRW